MRARGRPAWQTTRWPLPRVLRTSKGVVPLNTPRVPESGVQDGPVSHILKLQPNVQSPLLCVDLA